MNILFVRPNDSGGPSVPVGISQIQACLKESGHSVEIFDTTFMKRNTGSENRKKNESFGFYIPVNTEKFVKIETHDPIEALQQKIEHFKPKLLCFSIYSNDLNLANQIAPVIKCNYRDIPIVVGGIHPTVDPEGTIELDWADMICIGEGEEAIAELADKLSTGEDITDIKNLWIKRQGKIIKNGIRGFIDLNNVPPPDSAGFSQMHLYRPFWGKVYRILDVETSRGCQFACFECVNHHLRGIYKGKGSYHRTKTIDKAINDLAYLKRKYNIEIFRFIDEILFAFDLEYSKDFFDRYKSEVAIPFICFGRSEYMTDEKIKVFKDAGCISVSIGVETGNEKLRKKILNRKTSNKKIIESFQSCNKNRLRTMAFNMLALPEETLSNIYETIELNRAIMPSLVSAGFMYPFKGTYARTYCIEKGYIDKDPPLVNYDFESIIRNPYVSKEKQKSMQKTFTLYCTVPKYLFPLVFLCEFNNIISNYLYAIMSKFFISRTFKRYESYYDEVPDSRNLSFLENPPLGDLE